MKERLQSDVLSFAANTIVCGLCIHVHVICNVQTCLWKCWTLHHITHSTKQQLQCTYHTYIGKREDFIDPTLFSSRSGRTESLSEWDKDITATLLLLISQAHLNFFTYTALSFFVFGFTPPKNSTSSPTWRSSKSHPSKSLSTSYCIHQDDNIVLMCPLMFMHDQTCYRRDLMIGYTSDACNPNKPARLFIWKNMVWTTPPSPR